MTNFDESWFKFYTLDTEEMESLSAPITYTIELNDFPEIMRLCGATEAYYLGQIRWRVTHYDADLSAPFEIEVEIHCQVNPGYNGALRSLFGDEVASALLMEGEAYRNALEANFKENDKFLDRERRGEIAEDEASPYLGNSQIVQRIVDGLANKVLAERVFNRLLANSDFV